MGESNFEKGVPRNVQSINWSQKVTVEDDIEFLVYKNSLDSGVFLAVKNLIEIFCELGTVLQWSEITGYPYMPMIFDINGEIVRVFPHDSTYYIGDLKFYIVGSATENDIRDNVNTVKYYKNKQLNVSADNYIEDWKNSYGNEYSDEEKIKYMLPIFNRLEIENKIGKIIIDVGSGARPISRNINGAHKIISIDLGGDEFFNEERCHLNLDLKKLNQKLYSIKKSIIKICKNFDINLNDEKNTQVDTVIFSEILNYVDYEKVLLEANNYLKNNGRFIIINNVDRGYQRLFSKDKIKSNSVLKSFLNKNGFSIEEENFPWGETYGRKDKEMIFLVAQKNE